MVLLFGLFLIYLWGRRAKDSTHPIFIGLITIILMEGWVIIWLVIFFVFKIKIT